MGTSSHTGSTATVDRLLVGLMGSELEAMPRPDPGWTQTSGHATPVMATSPGEATSSSPTCEGPAELLEVPQDLLAQEVDEAGDDLWGQGQGWPSDLAESR